MRIRNPIITMPHRANARPRKPGPPENAVVKGLRQAIPLVVGGDFLILTLLVGRIVISLNHPELLKMLDGPFKWLFNDIPTGGVMLTGMVAVFLVAARLASIESDESNTVLIKDKQVQADRKESLKLQARICWTQMILAFLFIIGYVGISSVPGLLHIDPTKDGGRLFILILTMAEFSIPLLNMRTFSIVEESLKQIDIITAGIYEASNAAMMMLQGIGDRAAVGRLDKGDRRALKLTGDGKLGQALDSRADVDYGIDPDAKYLSLRMLVTGVRDGDPLDFAEWQRWHECGEIGKPETPQETRYNRALAISRRIRDSARSGYERVQGEIKTALALPKHEQEEDKIAKMREEEERYLVVLQQFDRGAHNTLLVSEEMGGRIMGKLSSFRPRKKGATRDVQGIAEVNAALAISGTLAE